MLSNHPGKILVVGYSTVDRRISIYEDTSEPVSVVTLQILLNREGVSPDKVVVFSDQVDSPEFLHDAGVRFVSCQMNWEEVQSALEPLAEPGDIVLLLSRQVYTPPVLRWCKEKGVRLLTISVECETAFTGKEDARSEGVAATYEEILSLQEELAGGAGAGLCAGGSPGLMIHLVQRGLSDIAQQQSLATNDYAEIARAIGLKTIVVIDRDSQTTEVECLENDFVSFDSAASLIDEGRANVELCLGEHEIQTPAYGVSGAAKFPYLRLLPLMGLQLSARGWSPEGGFVGQSFRSEAALLIAHFLEQVSVDGTCFRPSVSLISEHPLQTQESFDRLGNRGYLEQERVQIVVDEITGGGVEVGALLLGDFGAWWVGVTLMAHQCRAVGLSANSGLVLSAVTLCQTIKFVCENPESGICFPYQVESEPILAEVEAVGGVLTSRAVEAEELGSLKSFAMRDLILNPLNWGEESI
jgi:homospermidine synthase